MPLKDCFDRLAHQPADRQTIRRTHISLLVLALAVTGAFACRVQAKTMLEGRIEEIVQSGTYLPPQLTLKKLTPQTDARMTYDASIAKWVPSYPESFLGRWGGELKNTWVVQAPYTLPNPTYRPGNTGKVVLNFYKEKDKVELAPTVVFFPPESEYMTPGVAARLGFHNGDKTSMENEIGYRPGAAFRYIPVMPLRQDRSVTFNNSALSVDVLRNSLRMIKAGCIEQDFIAKQWLNGSFDCYREVVTRFTWRGPGQIYAQVAVAEYDENRAARTRSLMEGWISPNWRTVAQQIAKEQEKPWEVIAQKHNLR